MKFFAVALVSSLFFISCNEDDTNNNTDDNPQADATAQLYASNTSNGAITIYDVTDNQIETKTLLTASASTEGIYYDAPRDQVIQASRTMNQLDAFGSISATDSGLSASLTFSSTSEFSSPRDIAVNSTGNTYVVSDNGNTQGRYFIFTKTDSGFTLRNTVTVDFPVWEIEFIGNDLYAVVDNSSDLVVFENFLANNTVDATVAPTKRVTVDGIVRTHGLAYDGTTMVMTDIGDAGSDLDGAFHIIPNFLATFSATADGGNILVTDQLRFSGRQTSLGNPVSVDYDATSNTVFIAEIANGGGQVLIFQNPTSNNVNSIIPKSQTLAGASSVYFYREPQS